MKRCSHGSYIFELSDFCIKKKVKSDIMEEFFLFIYNIMNMVCMDVTAPLSRVLIIFVTH